MIEATDHDNEDVRYHVASLLAQREDRAAVEPLFRILQHHQGKRDEEVIMPLLSFQDPRIDERVVAEFEKGDENFRIRLASIVGSHVASGKARPVLANWLAKIAADESLGGIQRGAEHNLRRASEAAKRSQGDAPKPDR